MDATKLKDIVTSAIGREQLEEFARELGAVKRQSKVHMMELVTALILAARTNAGGRQAEAMRVFRDHLGGARIARSTYYERFNSGLVALMQCLLDRALEAARADPVRLPPSIAFVEDWLIQDATTVKLHDALVPTYPGAGDYAALKVHKLYSIGRENLIGYRVGPAREHDAAQFKVDASWRGKGVLVDLGYVSHAFIRDCDEHGVSFVIRLKEGWKASVKGVAVGELTPRKSKAPLDLAHALSTMKLRSDDGVLDADIELPMETGSFPVRLVMLQIKGKGICTFLTNVPRDKAPATLIADLYRLRWNIEHDNRLNKSDWVLDEIDGEKPESVEVLVYASLLGSVIVNRIVHADTVERLDTTEPARVGPLHVRLVALTLATSAQMLAVAIVEGDESDLAWTRIARGIDAGGRDPNWRRTPSVLDIMHGFNPGPAKKRQDSVNSPPRNKQ